jgi:integrase
MIQLPNNCKASISVHPKNWQTSKASMKDWYISYRFYDPSYPKPKQVIHRGMNRIKKLSERQKATKDILRAWIEALEEGYNPFLGGVKELTEISTDTPVFEALKWAASKVTVSEITLRDLNYTVKCVTNPKYRGYPVSEIKRKHVKEILEGSKTPFQYNKDRSYLMILFEELAQRDIIEINPVTGIKKKKTVKKVRRVLTEAEREALKEHLPKYPEFYRFLQIFFHSGSRISELMRMKGRDIDLKRGVFRVIVQKGKEYREVEKVIKDVALSYWSEIKATPDQYIFSVGLKPGARQIKPYQITKRWYRLVKQKLGIEADFYALKHLNTDETSAILGIKDAALHNSHTTPVITLRYAVTEKDRERERLRKVDNRF